LKAISSDAHIRPDIAAACFHFLCTKVADAAISDCVINRFELIKSVARSIFVYHCLLVMVLEVDNLLCFKLAADAAYVCLTRVKVDAT
jgi:hypothetical protein